jgi:resolvase-like protein
MICASCETHNPPGNRFCGTCGAALSPENSRTVKEKSHRAPRRCYRSGVEASLRTIARRLDGHRLYTPVHVRIRVERQARRRRLRHARYQHGRRGHPAERPRYPAPTDQALGRLLRRSPAVLCIKLDRLARSTRHLVALAAELEALGVDLVALDQAIDTTTPSGRLLFHVLAAIADDAEPAIMQSHTAEVEV